MDKQLKNQLDIAAKAMSRATALIKEGEEIKKRVKEEVLPLMVSFDIKVHEVDGVGKVSSKQGGGSTINRNKLVEELLLIGMGADAINEVIDRATKSWSYEYLEFNGVKK